MMSLRASCVTVGLLSSLFLLAAPGCGMLHMTPRCGGGARPVGESCQCALGTTWNGQACQGQPQAGVCQGGRAQYGSLCFCPDGTTFDGARCVALDCRGQNAVISGNECICAEGTSWSGAQNRCVAFTCNGGSVVSGNDCVCVNGETWQDGRCALPPPPPPAYEERPHYGHRGHQDSSGGCNAYGCWRNGGGCNAYGCWNAPQGDCNAYGCSDYGGCNAYGCWHSPQGACNAYGCSDRGECNAYGCP